MAYQARLRILPLCTVIDIKGTLGDVTKRLHGLGLSSPAAGRASNTGTLELLRPAPQHWLLLAPLVEEERLLQSLLEPPPAADTLVLAVSDQYQFFAVDGPDARQLMVIASPLDVDPSVFPADGATFSEAFGLKALLLRRSHGFDLAVERSYAHMVQAYFARINPQTY